METFPRPGETFYDKLRTANAKQKFPQERLIED